MTPRSVVITLTPTSDIMSVLDIIATTEHTGFPVMEGDSLIGIITNKDVRELCTTEMCPTIREAMTTDLHVINPENTLEDALELMVSYNMNHIPVVEKTSPENLIGFITRTDILKAYVQSSQ